MFLTVTVRNDKGEAVGLIILKDKEFSSGKGGGAARPRSRWTASDTRRSAS